MAATDLQIVAQYAKSNCDTPSEVYNAACRVLAQPDEVERLRAEVAQLREGESDEPAAPHTAPTPGQLLRRLNDASAEERLQLVGRMLDANDRAAECFRMDHGGRLEYLEIERDALSVRLRDALGSPEMPPESHRDGRTPQTQGASEGQGATEAQEAAQ
jgi:hypothetical protein